MASKMEVKKPRKQRQQVQKVQYVMSKNVIELTFDEGLGFGCRSEGRINI